MCLRNGTNEMIALTRLCEGNPYTVKAKRSFHWIPNKSIDRRKSRTNHLCSSGLFSMYNFKLIVNSNFKSNFLVNLVLHPGRN